MKTLTAQYTVFGYEIVDESGTEIQRGGNHPMCSESVLQPAYIWDKPHYIPLKLEEIKALAVSVLTERCLEQGAKNGGLHHDKDGQTEMLLMLDMGDHPLVPKAIRDREKAKMKALFA